MKKRIYFDNAASTPLEPEVIAHMSEAMLNVFGNPSSVHNEGRIAKTLIEKARKVAAEAIGASIGEIYFTSCGTESNNMILKGCIRDLDVKRIISSPIEHHCILHTLDHIEKHNPFVEIVYLNVDADGTPDFKQLESILSGDDTKTLVSLMHVNNELGTMIDLTEVGEICARNNALFHSDSVQSIGLYDINVNVSKVNFLAASAHKFYGPKGIGFVYIKNDNILSPFIDGGAQERNMRAGTENIYGIAGLSKALELAISNMDDRRKIISGLKAYMRSNLETIIPNISFNGNDQFSSDKILSVNFPFSPKSELLVMNMDIAGISASGGSACSSGAEHRSDVLNKIGVAENIKTIRFSFSHHNTKDEIDFVIEKLKSII